MKYELNLGRLRFSGTGGRQKTGKFRLAILADLSGRANHGELETGKALATRRPMKVDVDRLDSLLGRLDLRLHLPIGQEGGTVEVAIESMDDFHPDELYEKLEIFSELAAMRRRLKSSSTFAGAAKEVRAWLDEGPTEKQPPSRSRPAGLTMPRGKLSDFSRLLGRDSTTPASTPSEALIRQIVAPHVVPSADPEQESLVASADQALAGAMRSVLHHPDFQAAESIWRSIDLLVRRLETNSQLEIVLYDITAEEIAADLSSTNSLEQTGLFHLLVEEPATDQQQGPLSVLIGNYLFERTPPHAELLGRMARIAAAAQAPFIAGMSVASIEQTEAENEVHPLIVESWTGLRNMPHACYLGLTVPRFLLRWPYGAKTEPIDPFAFEEFTTQDGLKGMLWGNGAILAGLLLGQTCSQQDLESMELGSILGVDDMPFYWYTDEHGDTVALPCTERVVYERNAAHLTSEGFIPVLSIKGRPEVRLGGLHALGRVPLAGPWAPVVVEEEEEVVVAVTAPVVEISRVPAATASDLEPDAEEVTAETEKVDERENEKEQEEELEVQHEEEEDDEREEEGLASEAAVSDDNFDAEPSPPAPPEVENDDADAELDALLAKLEQAEEADEGDQESDIDPELAKLLADL